MILKKYLKFVYSIKLSIHSYWSLRKKRVIRENIENDSDMESTSLFAFICSYF